MSPKEHWTEIDNLRIHYSQAGKGRPLLLIHGLLGGSFCWRFNLPVLAEQYEVYAVDLPGSGLSHAPPHTDCSMEAQATRLAQFIRKMELRELTVIGTSWGGAIALLLAALDVDEVVEASRVKAVEAVKTVEAVEAAGAADTGEAKAQPGRIRSLVLCAPVNPWSGFGQKRIKFLKTPVGGCLLRMIWPVSWPLHALALKRMYGAPARISPGSLEGYVSMIFRPGRARNVINVLRNWRKDVYLLQGMIGRVKVPTLLVWGTKDGAVDIRSADMLREKLPKCELTLFSGVGHLPFEEVPGEFNERVLEFLGRQATTEFADQC
jgi:pimeloyl-ACP methyl ester carboxylesterase